MVHTVEVLWKDIQDYFPLVPISYVRKCVCVLGNVFPLLPTRNVSRVWCDYLVLIFKIFRTRLFIIPSKASFQFSGQPFLFWVSSYMSLWSNILFNCAVLINLIVAFFYPFMDTMPSKCRSCRATDKVVTVNCARFVNFEEAFTPHRIMTRPLLWPKTVTVGKLQLFHTHHKWCYVSFILTWRLD